MANLTAPNFMRACWFSASCNFSVSRELLTADLPEIGPKYVNLNQKLRVLHRLAMEHRVFDSPLVASTSTLRLSHQPQ